MYAAELICSTGVLGFQTNSRFAYIISCVHMLKFPWIQPSAVQSVSFECVYNGRPWNPKLTLLSKRPLGKNQSSKFCQSGVKQTHFQNLKEKRKWFFLSQGHFKCSRWKPMQIENISTNILGNQNRLSRVWYYFLTLLISQQRASFFV